jgi:hypothetical protein
MDLIEYALRENRRLFGNAPPTWQGAPSASVASTRRTETIERLEALTRKYPRAAQVAERLNECKRCEPCMSPACPVCSRAFQRMFVNITEDALGIGERDGGRPPIVAITLVDPKANLKRIADLDEHHLKNFYRRVRRALDAIGHEEPLIAGLDISRNLEPDDDGISRPHCWSPHLQGFTRANDHIDLRKALVERFMPTDTVPNPIWTGKCDGSNEGLSYACKPGFCRRISYFDDKGHRNTHRQPTSLKAKEDVRLGIALNDLEFSDRLFLYRARVNRCGDSIKIQRL